MTGDEREEERGPEGHETEAQESEVEELQLADDDERLPWLESADYEDEEEGVDTARILGFVLLGLIALALLIGGIWWATNRGPNPELVADGSTIEAPAGDYKERPADAGGREVEGTGDTSFAVGEGQTREGRLAEAKPVKVDTKPSVSPENNATTSETAAASGGVGVQVGAYSTEATAQAGWTKLQRQTDALSGFKYRIVKGEADIGTVFRLQAVAGDRAAANQLCSALKSDGVACQVK